MVVHKAAPHVHRKAMLEVACNGMVWNVGKPLSDNCVRVEISTHVDITSFTQNKPMNNRPKFGRLFEGQPVQAKEFLGLRCYIFIFITPPENLIYCRRSISAPRNYKFVVP
jgi:hypothetical protein